MSCILFHIDANEPSPSIDFFISNRDPDSKVHEANIGPIWGRQDQGGLHIGPWTLLSGEGNIANCKADTIAICLYGTLGLVPNAGKQQNL